MDTLDYSSRHSALPPGLALIATTRFLVLQLVASQPQDVLNDAPLTKATISVAGVAETPAWEALIMKRWATIGIDSSGSSNTSSNASNGNSSSGGTSGCGLQLQQLDLSGGQLSALPGFPGTTSPSAAHPSVTSPVLPTSEFPSAVSFGTPITSLVSFVSITSLDLSRNRFKRLPGELACLPCLRALNVSRNFLKPTAESLALEALGRLANLVVLDLRFNER